MNRPWVVYLVALAIYFGTLSVLGLTGFTDIPSGMVRYFLFSNIGQALGMPAPDAVTFSLKNELKILFLSPGFYSAIFVGYKLIERPGQVWKGFVPSLILMAPFLLIFFALYGQGMLLLLVSWCFPYSIIGAVLGWKARIYRERRIVVHA